MGKKIDEKTDELLLSLFNALADYKDKRDIEALEEYLIHQAVANAYKDATNQGAFNAVLYKRCHFEEHKQEYIKNIHQGTVKDKEKEAKKKFKEDLHLDDIKREAIKGMVEFFEKFPGSNASYNDWHSDLCKHLMGLYNNRKVGEVFTYGNIQKWVNMAVKYLYVFSSLLEEMDEFKGNNSLFHNIIEQEAYLHVPIDRYIIKAVFNYNTRKNLPEDLFTQKSSREYNYANCEGKLCYNEDKDGNIIKLCEKHGNSDYRLTWSNIRSYSDYNKIQTEIQNNIPKEKMSPLEWENKVWLKMSVKK